MSAAYTADEVRERMREFAGPDGVGALTAQMNRWLKRGSGIAFYANHELGTLDNGHVQILSFGTPDSLVEAAEPPARMPDVGQAINWRYVLEGTYRGEEL